MADDPQLVDATSPDGDPFKIPIENIAKAKALGWDVADPHDTLGQTAAAGAEGFLKGLIPGAPAAEAYVSKKLGSTAGSEEEQKARAEASPWVHGGGEFAGTGVQMAGVAAATEGLGLAGEAGELATKLSPAAEAAKAVQGGADAAEAASAAGGTEGAISAAADAAAARAPTSAAEAAQRASQATRLGYASQVTAGGVQGGSNYINEAELGDHDFNGEALAMNIGLGGLFGAAGEGVANVLGKTIAPKVISKAGEALDGLKEKVGSLLEKGADTLYPEARGKFGPAWEAMKGKAEGFTDSEAEKVASTINDVGSKLESVGKEHETSFRPSEAEKNLGDIAAAPVKATLNGYKDQILQNMGEIQNKIDGGIYDKVGAFNAIKKDLTHFEGELAREDLTTAELHEATKTFKQAIGESGLFDTRGVRTPEAQRAIDDITANIWAPTKAVMRDTDLWGAQGARNAALDAATSVKMNAAKQVAKDFGATELDLSTGKKELYIKPSKVRTAFAGDPLSNQERLQHLGEYIDASKAYLAEVEKSAGAAGAVVPGGDDLSSLLETLTAQRHAAEQSGAVTQLERSLSRTIGRGPMEAGIVPGLVAHAAGLGIPGIGAVAGIATAIRSPVRTMQMFAKIAKASETARNVIGSGVRKIFSSAPSRAALTGEVSSALRGRTVQSFAGAASGQDFQRQSKHITEIAQDQQRQMDSLSNNTSRLSDVAPQTTLSTHGAAIRAMQALYQALPKNPSPSLLQSENKDWQPSDSDLHAWDDLHAAVLKPPRILAQIADGTASPETWATLQQVYPKWTAEVQQQTIDHLTSHPRIDLSQAQKNAVSMIVGSPISPTVSPDQIAFQQAMYATQPNPMAPPGGMPKQHRPSQHGMDKIDLGPRSALGPQSRRRG